MITELTFICKDFAQESTCTIEPFKHGLVIKVYEVLNAIVGETDTLLQTFIQHAKQTLQDKENAHPNLPSSLTNITSLTHTQQVAKPFSKEEYSIAQKNCDTYELYRSIAMEKAWSLPNESRANLSEALMKMDEVPQYLAIQSIVSNS